MKSAVTRIAHAVQAAAAEGLLSLTPVWAALARERPILCFSSKFSDFSMQSGCVLTYRIRMRPLQREKCWCLA